MYEKLDTETLKSLHAKDPEIFFRMVEHLFETVEGQHNQILELAARVQYLEDQIAKDSHNSSKPPSSDGFKKKTKSLRKKSNRKVGGQKGHKGHTLKMVDNPDVIEVYKPDKCECCNHSLKDRESDFYEKRQEFDIPEIKIRVIEHRAEIINCHNCGHENKGQFPEHVKNVTQYSGRLKSYAVYLNKFQLIPYDRLAQLFKDLYNHHISQGSLVNFTKECHKQLEKYDEAVKEHMINEYLLHFDETGIRKHGLSHWLHVSSNDLYTYYMPHEKRGKEAIDAMNILPRFNGRAVHDHWKAYFKYPCLHSLCNAHHLRELKFVEERFKQDWEEDMTKLLLKIKETVDKSCCHTDKLDNKMISQFEDEYFAIIEEGTRANLSPEKPKKPGPKKHNAAQNLLRRLKLFSKEVLAFMYDFRVPFDNNQVVNPPTGGLSEIFV